MKSFLSGFFFLLLPFFFSHPLSSVSATITKLDEVCEVLASDPDVTTSDCYLVFQQDPRSRTTTDYDVFGLIAVNITARAATEAITGMKHTLIHVHNSLNKEQNSAIVKCIRMYEKSIPAFQFAAGLIKSKDYLVAQYVLQMANDLDAECGNVVMNANNNMDKKAENYVGKYRTFYSTAVKIVLPMAHSLAQRLFVGI